MTEEIQIITESINALWAVGLTVGGLIGIIIKLWRGSICYREALLLLANSLKVEDKMIENTFRPELLQKVDEVGEIIGAAQAARNKAKEVLININRAEIGNRAGFLKVGSYKGNPIYASDIFAIWRKIKK